MKHVWSKVTVWTFAVVIMAISSIVAADDYAGSWGPEVGVHLPVLAAKDQAGMPQTLSSLTGQQGLLLFMNRSADW